MSGSLSRAGFRTVLHEWARRKLTEHGHTGPFQILDVHVYYERGNGSPETPASDEAGVLIKFRHPGGCPDWSRPEWPCQPKNVWSFTDTVTTVEILNELLAIADDAEHPD